MTNKQKRITMDMSGFDAMVALCEGNPGAASALARAARAGGDATIVLFLALDDLGIYGSRIWQLYKDVCGQRVLYFGAVVRATQLGFITEDELNEHIGDDTRRGKPFADLDGILAEVTQHDSRRVAS